MKASEAASLCPSLSHSHLYKPEQPEDPWKTCHSNHTSLVCTWTPSIVNHCFRMSPWLLPQFNDPTELVVSLHPTKLFLATIPLAHYAPVTMTSQFPSHPQACDIHSSFSQSVLASTLPMTGSLALSFSFSITFPGILIRRPCLFQLSYTNLLFSS